ncbi:MAG: ribosome biogenesis GTPase Der [Candidatus Nomurabacteria bacterium]|jgi:GTP-binding protein|nr:ribosome biogenesis GTPase Der [Candidatus Nomurabacteria bacterium]
MKQLPMVAIVGQTNAGKSALFNRLTRSREAIVAYDPGTTRDSVMRRLAVGNAEVMLVDTAGLKDPEDDFEATIQDQIDDAIESADLILLVLDSTLYPNDDDKKIAKKALKSGKKVILVLNKADLGGSLPETEFLRLGIKDIIKVSAEHNTGVPKLRELIEVNITSTSGVIQTVAGNAEGGLVSRAGFEELSERGSARARGGFPVATGETDPVSEKPVGLPDPEAVNSVIKIALIGRPNVGKSSLFNTIANKQQALASARAGTTRDVNRTELRFFGRDFEILDTAGVRRRGKQEVGIEKFSVMRTMAAILESDICVLILDATDPFVAFDAGLAGEIIEAGKGLILAVNKWDLVGNSASPNVSSTGLATGEAPVEADELLSRLSREYKFAPFSPVVLISAKTGKNVPKLLELALKIDESRHTTIKTSDLNRVLLDAVQKNPPAGRAPLPRPRYCTQTDVTPPWFVIYGSNLSNLHFSYQRYLENELRAAFPFFGTPIKFSFRDSGGHEKRFAGKSSARNSSGNSERKSATKGRK